MSFATLKKSSGKFQNLTKEIEKLNSSGKQTDERLWKPGVDKSGNGFAIIRFLPQENADDLPWAQVWSHAFQGPGGWLIENCPTTKGEKCPVCAHNSTLWNSGREQDKDVARKQKRKLSYYANIYVVKDPLNPENEGQVFLYKFGKRIFDKLSARMQPDENDYDPQPAINPFDLWSGADFKLKIKQVAGYWNYDDSTFASPGTLGGFEDEALEEIFNKTHSLKEFTDDSNFKTYEELDGRLKAVLGRAVRPKTFDAETEENEGAINALRSDPTPAKESWTEDVESFAEKKVAVSATSEDEALSYFQKLAEED
tara:strand:- start:6575 stop:7510 length:936 start_codon:yes stop_codon:yes gene_type:complete